MMKVRTILICSAALMLGLTVGFQRTGAAAGGDQSVFKVGKVSVRTVLRDCGRNAKYRAQVMAEQAQAENEIDQLRKQESGLQAGLQALKPGTTDYVDHLKELLTKQAEIEVKEQLVSQERLAKDHRWTEDLYKDILKMVDTVAKEKGLDMVIESDALEFPLPSSEELMMALRTNKLLYLRNGIDITKEVLERLDSSAK